MSNALMLTTSALQAPKDLKGVFEIDAFKANCVSNYEKTTGRKDGDIVFERERVLFMKTIKENVKLEQCTRPSIYFAFVELFASGLTLMDGLTYIIPYKETAQFQIGWKGRLEQMSRMPEINVVHEPQVVLTNELSDFEYQLGEDVRVLKHKPAKDRTITATNKIEFVYLILDTAFGKRCFIMSRQEVLTIRDTYSIPYKYYISKGGKYPDGKPMDPPFWITNEAEAFKKTIVKRAYKYVPKTPRQKLLDEKIGTYIDHEDGTVDSTQQAIDYGLDPGPQAITQGEPIKVSAQEASAQPEPKAEALAVEKPKRSHHKKEKAPDPGPVTATTPDGTTADVATGEVVESNPAADLPDLDAL